MLGPEEIESVPRPRALSQKNLRAEMQLDRTAEARAYYNKIRVNGYPSMGALRGSTLADTLRFLARHSWAHERAILDGLV